MDTAFSVVGRNLFVEARLRKLTVL